MRNEIHEMAAITQKVHTLRHITTGEFICLRQNGCEYVACFTDGDTAMQFRDELGLLEHVDIAAMPIGEAPFEHFWLDGDMIGRGMLTGNPVASHAN